MNRITIAGLFLLANIAGPAMADCSAYGGPMTASAITTLLQPGGGVYACYNPGSHRENNETLINGTQVQEYHTGGSTVELEGTYAITTSGSAGVITYTYNSGGAFSYNICVTPAGNAYQFVNTSTGTNYTIVVSASTSGC